MSATQARPWRLLPTCQGSSIPGAVRPTSWSARYFFCEDVYLLWTAHLPVKHSLDATPHTPQVYRTSQEVLTLVGHVEREVFACPLDWVDVQRCISPKAITKSTAVAPTRKVARTTIMKLSRSTHPFGECLLFRQAPHTTFVSSNYR